MTVLGVDVSWWQGKMDWRMCSDNGAKFAYIRAGSIDNTTGKCYTDYKFAENSLVAPEIMPSGYYWYFRPNWSATYQADYFSELIHKASWKLIPCGDVEADPSTWGKKITPDDYADMLIQFYDRIKSNLNIRRCRVYTRQSVWDSQVAPRDYWSRLGRWFARYNAYLSSPWGDGLYKFRDWQDWEFWQWSKTGDGRAFGTDVGSLGIDLNYFNGTLAYFYEYIGGWNTNPKEEWMQAIDKWARLNGYTGVTPTGE